MLRKLNDISIFKERENRLGKCAKYHLFFFGSKDGYQDYRSQITLYDGSNVLGDIRFHDTGMPFSNDSLVSGKACMHLPSTMFENVLNILSNEESINFIFAFGRGFLGTSMELISEGE